MHYKYLVLGVMFLGTMQAMNKFSKAESVYFCMPANLSTPRPVSAEELALIMPPEKCTQEGVVTALISRRLKSFRKREELLKIKKYGIEGDHHKLDCLDQQRVQGITLMRADVSTALGGAAIPGDDIHVSGLDLSITTLLNGAVIVITDRDKANIKAALLKTYVEYRANKKLINRCGQLAYDFLESTGTYECNLASDYPQVNGLRDRLRGVKLAVLREGEVALGDYVSIYSLEESKKFIEKYQLGERYEQLMERSIAIAQANQKQHNKEREEIYLNGHKKKSCCDDVINRRADVFMVFLFFALGIYSYVL